MTRKIKPLIKGQLPEFVVADHPRFVSFLEAYYEFMDINAIDVKNITDVDESLSQFESAFFNSFLPHIPRDIKINKEFVFKNILPMFQSKGSEKSFKYFFRLLFDRDIEISYPGENILRASDGKWIVKNILKLSSDVNTEYTADGIERTFYIADSYTADDFNIFIDDVGTPTGFEVFPEYYKIVFDTPPPEGSTVRIEYTNFNAALLANRQIRGVESGATAIAENAGTRRSGTIAFFEVIINTKTLKGNFIAGEFVTSTMMVGDNIVPLSLATFTSISDINIINPGESYNIGDPVIIRGEAKKPAVAYITNVTSGTIENLTISTAGSGYKITQDILANGFTSDFFHAYISAVDDSGLSSCNNIIYNTDLVSNIANITIDTLDYNLQAFATNANSTLIDALSTSIEEHLGGITQTVIDTSYISSSQKPTIYIDQNTLYSNTGVRDLGVLGTISIIDSGEGYEVGDPVIFGNTSDFSGFGASAYVSDVSANGEILFIRFNDGGLGYKNEALPPVTVESANGVGAVLEVDQLMGHGAILLPVTSNIPYGIIREITVLDGGIGYTAISPQIDLSFFGNGLATANTTVTESYQELDGMWQNSDGILSSRNTVLQGKDYYIDYSYLIKIEEEFSKFKQVLKNTIHPAGMVGYSRYLMKTHIPVTSNIVISSTINTIS